MPEPWATRLTQEGDGKVLVDERDLWPNGAFVTTHLIVANAGIKEIRQGPAPLRSSTPPG